MMRAFAFAPEEAAHALGISPTEFESILMPFLRPPRYERRALVAMSELEHWGGRS
jgi:hypothetical protein